MQIVSVRLRLPVSLRSAWLISRAWRPTWVSPISPSISACGISAATESIDDDVDRARADQHLGDLERLLAGVGLGDQQLVDVDADALARTSGPCACSASMNAQMPPRAGPRRSTCIGEGRLARGLRAEDLDDPAAREAADAEREVERRATRSGSPRCSSARSSPILMIEPLPNCRSICPRATSSASSRFIVVPPRIVRPRHARCLPGACVKVSRCVGRNACSCSSSHPITTPRSRSTVPADHGPPCVSSVPTSGQLCASSARTRWRPATAARARIHSRSPGRTNSRARRPSWADGVEMDEADRFLGGAAVRPGDARHGDRHICSEPGTCTIGHRNRNLGRHRAVATRSTSQEHRARPLSPRRRTPRPRRRRRRLRLERR